MIRWVKHTDAWEYVSNYVRLDGADSMAIADLLGSWHTYTKYFPAMPNPFR